MSDILSNEQIDKLLSAGGYSEGADAAAPDAGGDGAEETPAPALERIFSIFCEQMASVLRTVLNKDAAARLGSCGTGDEAALKKEMAEEFLCLAVPLRGGATGEISLLMKKSDVAVMADLMMMGEGNVPYAPEHDDAIVELTNQIVSSFVIAFNGESADTIAADPARLVEYSIDNPPAPVSSMGMVMLHLVVESKDETSVAMLFSRELGDALAKLLEEKAAAPAHAPAEESFSPAPLAAPVSAEKFSREPLHGEGIDILLDVDLDVSIELGKSQLSIKRILELAPGSIVELDRMAGEPVDLLVNNKVVARGEVVVIDESFGIRILSLVSPEERIKSLK